MYRDNNEKEVRIAIKEVLPLDKLSRILSGEIPLHMVIYHDDSNENREIKFYCEGEVIASVETHKPVNELTELEIEEIEEDLISSLEELFESMEEEGDKENDLNRRRMELN